jgi:biotin carboxyl carrier protein
MKYEVMVGDKEHTVEIGPHGEIRLDNRPCEVNIQNIDGLSLFSVLLNNYSYELILEGEKDEFRVLLEGEMYTVRVEDERTRRLAEGSVAAPSGEVVLKAPMPGLVVSVPVQPNDEVKMGQGLVILEAMKMENELRAPRKGRVKAVRVSPGQVVEQGQVLVILG